VDLAFRLRETKTDHKDHHTNHSAMMAKEAEQHFGSRSRSRSSH